MMMSMMMSRKGFIRSIQQFTEITKQLDEIVEIHFNLSER